MSEELEKKKERLYYRINELTALESDIARLEFFMNEKGSDEIECARALNRQLGFMVQYRDVLQYRIENGFY